METSKCRNSSSSIPLLLTCRPSFANTGAHGEACHRFPASPGGTALDAIGLTRGIRSNSPVCAVLGGSFRQLRILDTGFLDGPGIAPVGRFMDLIHRRRALRPFENQLAGFRRIEPE